jgi:hypothetical protein
MQRYYIARKSCFDPAHNVLHFVHVDLSLILRSGRTPRCGFPLAGHANLTGRNVKRFGCRNANHGNDLAITDQQRPGDALPWRDVRLLEDIFQRHMAGAIGQRDAVAFEA